MQFGRTRVFIAGLALLLVAIGTVVPAHAIERERSETVDPGSVDAFKLHSVRGAGRVIYLDFDGDTLVGTKWNETFRRDSIDLRPFDADYFDNLEPEHDDDATFNEADLAKIRLLWARVAEDFAPFAVDVTTEDPGFDAIDRSSPDDQLFGTRVVISNSVSSHYANAWPGSFDDAENHAFLQPALVSPYTASYDAISHVIGVTLGLSPDGTTAPTGGQPDRYYDGHNGWRPIMGGLSGQPLSQFSNGDYADSRGNGAIADNHEDDFAVMTSHGAPPVNDEAGNTIATAAPGTVGGTTKGIVGINLDADVYAVPWTGGPFSASARHTSLFPNLDLRLDLLNANGAVIATDDPPMDPYFDPSALIGLDAMVTANVPAGTYYLRVQGAGRGDPLADGYSRYGSVGPYQLQVGPAGATRTLSINDVTVEEKAETSAADFTVTLSRPSPVDVPFEFAVSGDPTDVVVGTGHAVLRPGQTSIALRALVRGDDVTEPDETFTVKLSNTKRARIADDTGIGRITNDDAQAVRVYDWSKDEGSNGRNMFTFVLALNSPAIRQCSVLVTTGDGTAKAGSDYGAVSQRVTFAPGELTKKVNVVIAGDKVREPDETFGLWLTAPVGLTVADRMGVATLLNDDV